MSSYKNKALYDWFRMSNNQVRATLVSTGFSYFSDECLIYFTYIEEIIKLEILYTGRLYNSYRREDGRDI